MIDIKDLEMVILGIVQKQGPCTPYAVRMEFERSPSPHFSSSPGSIYPIIARLHSRKWLIPRQDATGKRKRTLFRISAAGQKALRAWLTPPLPDEAVGLTYDPLRTRMYFLTALAPEEVDAYLDHVTDRLQKELDRAKRYLRTYSKQEEPLSWLATLGGVESLKARIRWIRKAREILISRAT